MLRFDSGEEFDTRGTLRLERRLGGWYVAGEGMLISVLGPREGHALIREMQSDGWQREERRGDR